MVNRTAQQDMASEGIVTLKALQAAEALRRREKIRKGGLKTLIREVIEHWEKSIPSPGEEFRTDESVREQHFLASLPRDDWRVPYGIDSPQARELVGEIEWCRKHDLSLDGLVWPPSHDPYAPANDPNHPYYLPKESD
jgi:hypothetical protein